MNKLVLLKQVKNELIKQQIYYDEHGEYEYKEERVKIKRRKNVRRIH